MTTEQFNAILDRFDETERQFCEILDKATENLIKIERLYDVLSNNNATAEDEVAE